MFNAIWSSAMRQAGEPSGSPDYLAIVVTVATAVLAVITLFYMLETRRLRITTDNMLKTSQQPSFALEPSQYLSSIGEIPGEKFLRLNLVNHGQTATDIIARCIWLPDSNSAGSSKDFYVISLAKDGYAGLDVPVEEIVRDRLLLKIEIKCKDAGGNDYSTVITNGLDKIRGTNTKMAYQNNYWFTIYDALDRISDRLGNIERKIK